MTLSNAFGCFFSHAFKTYGMNVQPHPPISDSTLTWAASIGSGTVNGLSRILMGAAVDKCGFKKLFTGLVVIQLINSLVCYSAAWYPAVYFACVLINFWCLGGLF